MGRQTVRGVINQPISGLNSDDLDRNLVKPINKATSDTNHVPDVY